MTNDIVDYAKTKDKDYNVLKTRVISMWAKQLGVTDGEAKYHYIIDNVSACNKVSLTSEDYVKYNESVEDDKKCENCLKELRKLKAKMMYA